LLLPGRQLDFDFGRDGPGNVVLEGENGSQLPLVVRVLDAVTVGLALMLICWVPILEQVYVASRFNAGTALMSLSIPVGDVLVVALLWSAIANSRRRLRPSMLVLGIGFVSITIADLALAYASATGTLRRISCAANGFAAASD